MLYPTIGHAGTSGPKQKRFSRIGSYSSENEKTFDVNYKAGYLREIEELYSTNSIYQTLKVKKKFSTVFTLNAQTHIEYAKREEVDEPEARRWFDNSSLKADISFNDFNTLSIFGGGSFSDTTITLYGTSLQSRILIGESEVINSLVLSYDYFYYWNRVAQNYVSENVQLKYNDFNISAGYFFGVVDFNYVDDYEAKAKNPNSLFSLDIQYRLLQHPVVNLGFGFNTRDFKYQSPLYYSPQDRKISGIYSSIYDAFNEFYFYMGSGARVDNNSTFIWDIDLEAGYDANTFSASVGISRYNDPYYTSYNTFLNLTKSF